MAERGFRFNGSRASSGVNVDKCANRRSDQCDKMHASKELDTRRTKLCMFQKKRLGLGKLRRAQSAPVQRREGRNAPTGSETDRNKSEAYSLAENNVSLSFSKG